ncbi:hypothetical protein C8R46DRAFT_1106595 [Mycena filopes]|nr:hypothetical protein C8R46DRAFT_1106595 [Mycena filopes]
MSLSQRQRTRLTQGLTRQELRVRASSLDSETTSLRARMHKLLAEREAIQEGLDAIVYPVLTLPVEITSQIFCWVPVLPTRRRSDSWIPLHEYFVLGQICRLWRQIALSTPELWNTVDLRRTGGLHRRSSGLDRQPPFRLQTFLSRAASRPLSISLSILRSKDTSMLDVLASHSRTWGNLNFVGPFQDLNAFRTITHQLPLLKSLQLILDRQPDDDAFGTMFQHAPLLRTVHLCRFGSQQYALPWSQLTSLHILICSGPDFAKILGWTPNLIHLAVESVFIEPGARPFPPLPRLQSLVFVDARDPSQPTLISLLATPLQKLRIGTRNRLCPPIPHSASLEELWVNITVEEGLGDENLHSISLNSFAGMTRLRSLTLVVHYPDPTTSVSVGRLIHRLAVDLAFLPALESLAITLLQNSFTGRSQHPSFDMDTLSAMLCARWSGSQLRNFELRSSRRLPKLDAAAAKLTTQGMRIHLESALHMTVPPASF